MRRIGIAAIIAAVIAAILAGTISGSALAQSLRPAYAPDGVSQSAQSLPIKRVVHVQRVTSALAPKTAPSRAAAVPQSDGTVTAPTYATPAPQPPIRGLNAFFATIFVGPIMLSHAFRPNESTYYRARRRLMRRRPMRRRTRPIRATVRSVTAKREWPDWRPPAEMLARRPDLPRFMPGGIDNPRSARARFISARACIVSMARTSPGPSALMCRQAVSACATTMSPVFISA